MKAGWQVQPLQSFCNDFKQDIVDGPFGSELQRKDYIDEGIPVLKIQNVKPFAVEFKKMDYVSSAKFQELRRHSYKTGDIVMTKLGAPLGASAIVREGIDGIIVADLVRIRAQRINTEYLCYHLNSPGTSSLINSMQKGTTRPRVTLSVVRELPIAVPSTSEQQRIVAILDEAFKSIGTAKANAEKNLENARALFESYLQSVFSQPGNGWKRTTLGAEAELLIGFAFKSTHYTEANNGIKLLRGDNIVQGTFRWDDVKKWPTDDSLPYVRYQLKEGDVVLAMDRPWVKAGLKRATISAEDLPCLLVQRTACLRSETNLDNRFLMALIGSMAFTRHILGVQTGSGVPHISGQQIKDFEFARPPLEAQREIVKKLEALQIETQRLESIYQQKLTALDELKKSLLHQAFTGQLTAAKSTLVSQHRELETASPQFAANIISLAYARHVKKRRERTFGRVKEQKVLHLVETIAKINLGRHPMKDAAGPNDFQHMLKAENWARAQDFFEMVDRGNGYDLKKLKNFDKHLSNARQELKPYLSNIEKVIDLLIPMDSEEAGIFATVHAAWNNLLIDGIVATNSAILKEARETWHADKLSIPEHKFKKAIEFIRRNGLVPDGTGKYVAGQTSLL